MAVEVSRRRFTVEEYHRMTEARILTEDDRVELIDGEIVEMTPIGSRHAACVTRLNHLFSAQVGQVALVSVQNPIRLGEHSEPQPDLALLRPRSDFYAQAHPGPGDILLVVEVAEVSAHYDRAIKLPLYAQAGIPEVWLVDLAHDRVEVCRSPEPRGYQEIKQFGRGQRLSPLALSELHLPAEAVLG